ncbi:hypothetical protein GGF49_005807, partial [Coemansia sp. RSA 1853]
MSTGPVWKRRLAVTLALLIVPLIAMLVVAWRVDKSLPDMTSVATQDAVEERELLPTNVTPTHYDLLLAPNLEALTYTGEVRIKVHINEETSEI